MAIEKATESDLTKVGANIYQPYGGVLEGFYAKDREVLLSSGANCGKAAPLDSVIWTPSGPIKMGNVKIGQVVLTPDGGRSEVVQIHPQGEQDIYQVRFNGGFGDIAECTLDHLWNVSWSNLTYWHKKDVYKTFSLKEIKEKFNKTSASRYWIPTTKPVDFNKQEVPIDPYLLGVLLGDGSMCYKKVGLTTADKEMVELIRAPVEKIGYKIGPVKNKYYYPIVGASGQSRTQKCRKGYVEKRRNGKRFYAKIYVDKNKQKQIGAFDTEAEAYSAINDYDGPYRLKEIKDDFTFLGVLDKLDLEDRKSWDKFIPEIYKINSQEVRLAVLQGLMDTDGYVNKKTGNPGYSTCSPRLANDVKEIIESLGGICNISKRQPKKNGSDYGRIQYVFYIKFIDNKSLFRLTRKKDAARNRDKYKPKRLINNIEFIGRKECQCITIADPKGLYLTDHFIVTHNSLGILSKLYLCCEKYPGIRCLMVRKTRESLIESAQVTWEQQVVPAGHPMLNGAERKSRQSYKFPNGSEVIISGMRVSHRDNTAKIMSTEYDMVYCQEAIEIAEDEWEKLLTRLRNNKMPYQQIIADTNPSAPNHWLKRRCNSGKTRYIECHLEDNPTIWDRELKCWTEFGKKYVEGTLDSLTGARLQRLRYGKWVQSEGVVYENWSPKDHVIPWFKPPDSWQRFLSIDFGFVHSFCCQFWAVDHDGRMYLYRELVRTKTLVEDCAKLIAEYMEEDPSPIAIVCDPADAEGRRTIEKYIGRSTTPADKHNKKKVGIQEVGRRLTIQGDGKPRLFVMDDALVDRQKELDEAKRPIGFIEEIDGYVWHIVNDLPKEEPVEINDDSMAAARYMAMHLFSSPKWIEPTKLELPERPSWTKGIKIGKPENNPFKLTQPKGAASVRRRLPGTR